MKIFKRIKKGFTLVELVVVIAVIAILAAVSVGAYFGVTESANASRLEQEAKQVYTAIQTVSLAPNDHSSLTSNGLVITNEELFEDKLEENLGKDVNLAEVEDVVVDNIPTIYFATSSLNPIGGAGITYKSFSYYIPEIGNKKATADVVSGSVNVVGATVTKEETNNDQEECEHNYESVETPATCTADGYTTHTCSLCGDSYTDSVVTATGHTPGTVVHENTNDSTCKTEGSYDEVVYCSVCETELSRTTKTIDVKAHIPAEAVVENKVESTCKAEGSYHEVVYCSICHDELSRETKTIAKKPHTPVVDPAVESTCTSTGLTQGSHCSVCNEVITVQEEVVKKDHTWSSGTCTVCNDECGHEWVDSKCNICKFECVSHTYGSNNKCSTCGINKPTISISKSYSEEYIVLGQTNARITATSSNGATVKYYSSNTSILTVNEATGAITPKTRGTAKVYATLSTDNSIKSQEINVEVRYRVYFENNWNWSDVKIYLWDNSNYLSAHPGNNMIDSGKDNSEGKDIYYFDIPASYTKMQFNGIKDDGSGTRNQSPDISIADVVNRCYYMFWVDGTGNTTPYYSLT